MLVYPYITINKDYIYFIYITHINIKVSFNETLFRVCLPTNIWKINPYFLIERN